MTNAIHCSNAKIAYGHPAVFAIFSVGMTLVHGKVGAELRL